MELVYNTNNMDGTTIGLFLSDSVNALVDWGDGNADSATSPGYFAHTYSQDSIYNVTITGELLWFGSYSVDSSIIALENVISFGNLGLASLLGAFHFADSLKSVPSELPSSVADLSGCFSHISQVAVENLDQWDVGNVTDISYIFYYSENFNQDISTWNVGSVTKMTSAFENALSFNQDIGSWDVSNVIYMHALFNEATSFNQGIGNWDMSNVLGMSDMFTLALNFNQDIGDWNVGKVVEMGGMFGHAHNFNQDISNWDVSNVIGMEFMFADATSFDQDIGNWDVSNVIRMQYMFFGATDFNQDIGNWNVSSIVHIYDMAGMFSNASSFNQDISGWCVEQLPEEPSNFSNDCPLQENFKPHWGEECITSTNELFSENIRVYPNPAKTELYISTH